jgi:type III secretion protein L
MDEREKAPAAPARVVGKVIKSEGGGELASADKPVLRPPRAGLINAEEYDARSTARQIIAEGEKKRDELIADGERRREEIFAKATEDAKAEVAARASEELARAKMQAGQVLAASERDILELALRVASKIIGRELDANPDLNLELVATAIENARGAKAMVLRVNPADGQFMREKRPRLMELVGRQLDLAVRDDPDVERYGCIIQTEFGTIDAQVKTQFEMLRTVLMPDLGKKDGLK